MDEIAAKLLKTTTKSDAGTSGKSRISKSSNKSSNKKDEQKSKKRQSKDRSPVPDDNPLPPKKIKKGSGANAEQIKPPKVSRQKAPKMPAPAEEDSSSSGTETDAMDKLGNTVGEVARAKDRQTLSYAEATGILGRPKLSQGDRDHLINGHGAIWIGLPPMYKKKEDFVRLDKIVKKFMGTTNENVQFCPSGQNYIVLKYKTKELHDTAFKTFEGLCLYTEDPASKILVKRFGDNGNRPESLWRIETGLDRNPDFGPSIIEYLKEATGESTPSVVSYQVKDQLEGGFSVGVYFVRFEGRVKFGGKTIVINGQKRKILQEGIRCYFCKGEHSVWNCTEHSDDVSLVDYTNRT